jgi:hypothetical protein
MIEKDVQEIYEFEKNLSIVIRYFFEISIFLFLFNSFIGQLLNNEQDKMKQFVQQSAI